MTSNSWILIQHHIYTGRCFKKPYLLHFGVLTSCTSLCLQISDRSRLPLTNFWELLWGCPDILKILHNIKPGKLRIRDRLCKSSPLQGCVTVPVLDRALHGQSLSQSPRGAVRQNRNERFELLSSPGSHTVHLLQHTQQQLQLQRRYHTQATG